MVHAWIGQVRGEVKASDPTPEATGAGGRNAPPLARRRAPGAPAGGGDPNDEGEGSGRKPDESRKGRRDEKRAPQPEDDYDPENDEEFKLFSQVMADALVGRTRIPAEPPALFKSQRHQDIGMWLSTSREYFVRNCGKWNDKAQ